MNIGDVVKFKSNDTPMTANKLPMTVAALLACEGVDLVYFDKDSHLQRTSAFIDDLELVQCP